MSKKPIKGDNRVSEEEVARLRHAFPDKLVISKKEIEEARAPFQHSLIGRFLGRRRSASNYLAKSLGQQWQTAGDVDIIPMAGGYYLFMFAGEEDLMKVWTGGPWVVGGLVLSLEPWRKNFRPSKVAAPKVCVWLRMPELPPECMARNIVLNIASKAGRPVEVDTQTRSLHRAGYARACVEIDLSQPLVPGAEVQIEGEARAMTFGKSFYMKTLVYTVLSAVVSVIDELTALSRQQEVLKKRRVARLESQAGHGDTAAGVELSQTVQA